MILVQQAQTPKGMCYICGTPIRPGNVITLVIPRGDAPRVAHLYCYALTQRRRQQQEQRRRELVSS